MGKDVIECREFNILVGNTGSGVGCWVTIEVETHSGLSVDLTLKSKEALELAEALKSNAEEVNI